MTHITNTLQKLIGIVFLLGLMYSSAYSQEGELFEMVKNEVLPEHLGHIKEAEKLIAKADVLLEESNKMNIDIKKLRVQAEASSGGSKRRYERKARRIGRRSIKRRFKAAGLYEQAHDAISDVYRKRLWQIRPKDIPERLELGKMLIDEAKQHFKAARSLRRKLNREEDVLKVAELVDESKQLEELGLTKQAKAFGVYLGWPEVMKEFEQDLKPQDEKPDTTTQTTDELVVLKDEDEKQDTSEVEAPDDARIVFSVQILATRRKPTQQRLQTVYSGSQEIHEQHIEGWYKYSIGQFDSYEQAARFRDAIGVYDSFVVASKNGKRIDIQEAIDQTKY